MLELRPSCEHCGTALPPDSPDARICSFECTFCAARRDEVRKVVDLAGFAPLRERMRGVPPMRR